MTAASKLQGQKSMSDRLATVRAATRVKPEQASKDLMRGSSRRLWCNLQIKDEREHTSISLGNEYCLPHLWSMRVRSTEHRDVELFFLDLVD